MPISSGFVLDSTEAAQCRERSLPAAQWSNNAPLERAEELRGEERREHKPLVSAIIIFLPTASASSFPHLLLTFYPAPRYPCILYTCVCLALNLLMLHCGDVCWQLNADDMKAT